MSEQNYLKKLLDGVEVEWTELGEIAKIKHGKDWKNLDSGAVPVYGSGGVMGYVNKYSYDKPTVLIPRKGTITNIFYVDIPFWNVDTIYYTDIATSKIIPKYFYHFMKSLNLMALDTGSGRPSLTQAILNKLLIPIPSPDNPEKSLAIQSEIVRILDTFTALTNELTNELKLREKQYNYYRDNLLNFNGISGGGGDLSDRSFVSDMVIFHRLYGNVEVEWVALGDVAKIQRGASPRPIAKYMTEESNGIPWIKIGDTSPGNKYINKTLQKVTVEGAKKSRILNPGDFVISNSMSFGRPYILRITGAIHDGWASISGFGERLNPDYLYHYLSSKNVQNYWESKINSGSVSNLNADIIKTLPVPLPDKHQQERISVLLDKFDTLGNSVSEGLPREIELRRKQYEYYRDLLLSFPRGIKSRSDNEG
ncbi:restriction endonuclease subunit S [Salmonella enterica]|nr:restriction endonuclease subunit S [Salmonella enterica subsp. diarizonae]EDZ0944998.1 restriction endonuclease subunit S [Salmonella enterica]